MAVATAPLGVSGYTFADLHEPELPHFESHRGHDAPYVPEVPRPPEPPRAPEPPRPRDMPRPPDRRPAEPRFPITGNEQRPGPLDWLRAKPKPAAAPSGPSDPVDTPPMDDAPDEAPPFRLPPRQTAPAAPEPIAPPPHVEQPMPRATPQPEPAKDHEGFDLVWPDRAAAASPSEPLKRASDMPLPPIPARPRDNRPPERRPEAPAKPAERGPAILKSGVIDGMPYTLYADGSIEAELPQGTVKFASVDALRSHLERQG